MELRELSKAKFARVEKHWLQLLSKEAHDVVQADNGQLLARIAKNELWGNIHERDNQATFYALFGKSDQGCWALVELIRSRRGKEVWIKMMDINLSPKIEMAQDGAESEQLRLKVFERTLIGIFHLTGQQQGADTVKVYGRTDDLVVFLRGMHDTFRMMTQLGTLQGIRVEIEDRWLVFRAT